MFARRNNNSFRYANNTTYMAEGEEEPKILLNVKKESQKAVLKLSIQKMKIMPSDPIRFSSVTQSSLTLCDPWTAACQASLSITKCQGLLKLMSLESGIPSTHLILCLPLLLYPSMFPSIRVFSNESALHIKWPKYLRFSFSISPSNEQSGLISFRVDWLDLLVVQGTLKILPQHHSSEA